MRNNKLEIGQVFKDLTVKENLGIINSSTYYLCECTCGNTRKVRVTHLNSGIVTHCGCKNFVSKIHANQKFEPQEAAFRAKASNYKALAKKRNIEFSLSIVETITLLKNNCFYCGCNPNNTYNVRLQNRVNKKNKIQYAANNSKNYSILYNGIDRIDNNKGYVINNVVSCCTKCNTAKLHYSLEEFKKWIINLYNTTIKNENTSH